MRFKTTWILFAVLVAVAAYFYLIDERRRVAGEHEKRTARKIFPYGPAEVERIILNNPAGVTIEMAREDEGWAITAPVRTAGSAPTINLLLQQTVPGQIMDRIIDIDDLEDFGLARPFASVILFNPHLSRTDTIFIGDKTPTSARCYVRVGSSDTVLVSRELTRNVMNKTVYHLRDKNFIYLRPDAVSNMRILNGRSEISIDNETGVWRFTSTGKRADYMKIEQYLARLSRALVQEFVTEATTELASYGLDRPERRLVLATPGDTITISFGNEPNHGFHVLRSGLDNVVVLTESFLDIFQYGADDLRAMNLSFTEPKNIGGIEFDWGGWNLLLQAGTDGWKIAGEDSLPVSPKTVTTLLTLLSTATFETILEERFHEPEAGARSSALYIELYSRTGEPLDLVTLEAADGNGDIGGSRSACATGRLPGGIRLELLRIIDRIAALR